MISYILVLVLMTSGGTHEYIMDHGLSLDDCLELAAINENTLCMRESVE